MIGSGIEHKVREIKEQVRMNLIESASIVEGNMHKLVAIKTGKLDASIHSTAPRITATGMEVQVIAGGATAPYAKFVDQPTSNGVKNFHRYGTVVYRGNGQFFAERAINFSRSKIYDIFHA